MKVSAINPLPARSRFAELVAALTVAGLALAADKDSRSLYVVYGRAQLGPNIVGERPRPGVTLVAYEVSGMDDLSFLLSAVVAAKGRHEFDHTASV